MLAEISVTPRLTLAEIRTNILLMTNRTAPAHTPATICGKRVRLWDDRIGIVQSAYGTTEGVDSIDVLIVSRPHVGIRRGGAITAAVARQRVVPDLGLDDVTILR